MERVCAGWHEPGKRRGTLLLQLPADHARDDVQPASVRDRFPSWVGLPCVLRATAHLVYVRLHGPDRQQLYAGRYDEAILRWWAERVGEWRGDEHAVHACFTDDGHGHAVAGARRLAELSG